MALFYAKIKKERGCNGKDKCNKGTAPEALV